MDPPVASADVAGALGRDAGEWRAERLAAGSTRGGGGIWRLSGADWSLVLKVVVRQARADRGGDLIDDPAHFFYWRREPTAYASGLLDDLPGIRAPRCLGVAEQPDGSYRLWLEDVGGPTGSWTLAQYGLAARHLGRFNGAYLRDRPLPDHPWLHRGYGALWRAETEDAVEPFRRAATWADPRARAVLTAAEVEHALAVWDDRDRLAAHVEATPTTLCHYDAFRGNAALVGPDLVLLDWEYVGLGSLGPEAAHLAATSVFMGHVPAVEADALDAAVFEGYLAGLADAGWRGDAQAVRRAYCASVARRWLTAALRRTVETATCDDPNLRARFERWLNRPIDECARHWADATRLLVRLADEVRA